MSDHPAKPFNEAGQRGGQSLHSYHSVWMAHWTRTSCDAITETHDQISDPLRKTEINNVSKRYLSVSGLEAAPGMSKSAKGLRGTGANNLEIRNENLQISPRNVRNDSSGFHYFPIDSSRQHGSNGPAFCHGEENSGMQAIRPLIVHSVEGSAVEHCRRSLFPYSLSGVPIANETSSRGYHSLAEGSTRHLNPSGHVKENIAGSSSHLVPYGFDGGKYGFKQGNTEIPSFMDTSFLVSNRPLPNSNPRMLEHNQSHSELLVCQEKLDSHPDLQKSMSSCLRKSNTPMLLDTTSKVDNKLPEVGSRWHQKMQNSSSFRLFPRHYNASDNPELKSVHGSSSLGKLPHGGVHDVETMRICTTLDSVAGISGCGPTFSQMTHSLYFTKRTNVNLSKENETLRNSGGFTKSSGNKSSKLHSTSPLFIQARQGVEIQSLGSSTDSEGKENYKDVETPKVVIENESLAETDTMDMDSFKGKNQIPGFNSSPLDKAVTVESDVPIEADSVSSKHVGCQKMNSELPDMNFEIPAFQAGASLADGAEQSSSRTQSLDMDVLLAHAEQPSNSKSNVNQDTPTKIDPCSRWVKRLKSSASDSSARGTKFSDLGEQASNRKGKYENKGISSSLDLAKKERALLLSHSWIRRWLQKGPDKPKKKVSELVVCEPHCSNLALEDLQEKQFPSIAAMALVGKAVNGFQPCELQKRGSFIVWNT